MKHTDPQILAEHNARELIALSGGPRTPEMEVTAHRNSAAAERDVLIGLISKRDALPQGAERDRLTREIAESRAFIERRLAKATELENTHQQAAE
jgi:hypothetical protein